jgi:hypothetical protein
MANQYDFFNLMKAGGYNPMDGGITTNQMDIFKTLGLINNVNKNKQAIEKMNKPFGMIGNSAQTDMPLANIQNNNPSLPVAKKPSNNLKQQQLGNMLLALSDIYGGRNPNPGMMQRSQMMMEQRNAAKKEADIESFLSTPEGSKYRQAYELKDLLGIDVSKTNDGTSLMQNAQALAAKRKRYAGMSPEEKALPDGLLLAQEIRDFEGLGGVLKYDAETEFNKNRAGEAGKQGRDFSDGPLTTGQIATDKGFATFYKDYLSKGRGAKNVANVERLDDAKEIMKYAAKNGIAISSVPFSLVAQRPSLSAFFSPEGVMAQERVASVIQQSLKEILGGQFAEREGIALIQRGYNPALNPEENLERLLDLEAQVLQIVESEQDAVEYYENNKKSLDGYKGKRYTSDDFVRDLRKDYTMDVIDMSDQDIEDAYMSAGEGSIWMETLTKEINRRADKRR